MDDLNAFVTFAAIVDTGSFSRASEKLGISKALASKHVVELERSLGVRLLNRTTRKLGVTEAGQVLYERCRELIAHADGARHEIEQLSSAPGGLIRVSAAMSFGRLHLVPAIADFLRQHPNVRIELDLNEKFADLVTAGADVVIRQAESPLLNALVARKLAQLRFVLCATPSYLREHRGPTVVKDLANHNCITYQSHSKGEWTLVPRIGDSVVIRVSGNYKANNADGVLPAVLADLGIGGVPSFAAAEHLRSGRLVRLLPQYELPERTLYAAHLANPHMAQRVHVFVRYLVDRFGPEPYWDKDLF